MENQNKSIYYVVGVVVLVVVGVLAFLKMNSSEEQVQVEKESATTTAQLQPTTGSASVPNIPVSNEPPSENPPFQGDVLNQPAYLIQATTTHGINYLGVDYVLVFQGEEATKAQIEDGLCTQASECTNNPKGYIRNKNPHYRSYEISTTTTLTVQASGALRTALEGKGMNVTSPTFNDLIAILPTMPLFTSATSPYKEAKTFVYIDIIGGGVTKIREP